MHWKLGAAALLATALAGGANAAPEARVWTPDAITQAKTKPDMSDPETGGQHYNAWLMGREGSASASLMVQMKAGQRSGAHVHTSSAHYSCVLKGVILLWVEGKIQRVTPGSCYTVPATLLHDVGADTTEDAWFVETTTPLPATPGFEPTRQDEVKARAAEIEAAFKSAQTNKR